MTEQEKQFVKAAKEFDERNMKYKYHMWNLIFTIDRLDTENKKLKAELDKAVDALVKS